MKQIQLSFLMLSLLSGAGISCKKSNSVTPTDNHWTLLSTTTYGISETVSSNNIASYTHTGAGAVPGLQIFFPTIPVSGSYATVQPSMGAPRGWQCEVVLSVESNYLVEYTSTYTAGDSVYVSVSGGKITATFNNLTVSQGLNPSYYVAGYPVSTSASGVFVQQ